MDLSSIATQHSAHGIGSLAGPGGMRGGPPIDKIMQNKDADGSGSLSIDEVKFSEKAFAKIDANEDGQLNTEELQAGREVIKEDLQAQGIKPPMSQGMRAGMGGGMKSQLLDLLSMMNDDTSSGEVPYRSAYMDGIDMMA